MMGRRSESRSIYRSCRKVLVRYPPGPSQRPHWRVLSVHDSAASPVQSPSCTFLPSPETVLTPSMRPGVSSLREGQL